MRAAVLGDFGGSRPTPCNTIRFREFHKLMAVTFCLLAFVLACAAQVPEARFPYEVEKSVRKQMALDEKEQLKTGQLAKCWLYFPEFLKDKEYPGYTTVSEPVPSDPGLAQIFKLPATAVTQGYSVVRELARLASKGKSNAEILMALTKHGSDSANLLSNGDPKVCVAAYAAMSDRENARIKVFKRIFKEKHLGKKYVDEHPILAPPIKKFLAFLSKAVSFLGNVNQFLMKIPIVGQVYAATYGNRIQMGLSAANGVVGALSGDPNAMQTALKGIVASKVPGAAKMLG